VAELEDSQVSRVGFPPTQTNPPDLQSRTIQDLCCRQGLLYCAIKDDGSTGCLNVGHTCASKTFSHLYQSEGCIPLKQLDDKHHYHEDMSGLPMKTNSLHNRLTRCRRVPRRCRRVPGRRWRVPRGRWRVPRGRRWVPRGCRRGSVWHVRLRRPPERPGGAQRHEGEWEPPKSLLTHQHLVLANLSIYKLAFRQQCMVNERFFNIYLIR